MSEEMSYNEALQELTRFQNVWQAAGKLKEMLHLATGAEEDVRRLRQEVIRLRESIHNWERKADAAKQVAQREIAQAAAKSSAQLQALKELDEKREQEHADKLAHRERVTNNTITHLERLLAKRREEIRETTASLNKEISIKQTLVRELDEQLSSLRRRLE